MWEGRGRFDKRKNGGETDARSGEPRLLKKRITGDRGRSGIETLWTPPPPPSTTIHLCTSETRSSHHRIDGGDQSQLHLVSYAQPRLILEID